MQVSGNSINSNNNLKLNTMLSKQFLNKVWTKIGEFIAICVVTFSVGGTTLCFLYELARALGLIQD